MLAERLQSISVIKDRAEGYFVTHAPMKICSARSVPLWYFQRAFAGFQLSDRHLSVIFFGEKWKSMTSLPPFLTLWTPFCDIFWREMKEYDKFTTISNSVDTRGVCWLFGWGYFNDQSANKTRRKAENWKFEIWFADDRDVHMRLQTLKVSLNMLMSYFYESRSDVWRRSWDIRYDDRR